MNWFSSLKPSPLEEKLWVSCITAFGEAFENAVYHSGTLPGHTKPTSVSVEVMLTDTMVQIKIWDSGQGFDLEQRIKELPESVPLHAERGRGLWIIKQVADYVSYSQTSDHLNCLTIQKFWPSSDKPNPIHA